MANTWRTHMSIVHENEHMPYTYRTVHIPLTDEQIEALANRPVVGMDRGLPVYEEVYNSWLENYK